MNSNNNNDLLYESALEFERFLNKKIILILGRKYKKKIIEINFLPENFHHLVGLHKLKDIVSVSKGKASNIFNSIIYGDISFKSIENSSYLSQIEKRLEIVSELTYLLSNKNTVFKFCKLKIPNSNLRWDYLIEAQTKEEYTCYLFIRYQRDNKNNVLVSCFPKREDYGFKQTRYTLLQTSLVDKDGNEKIFYERPNYNANDSQLNH